MAVESFNNFISKIDDDKTKKKFQEVQTKHRENIDLLANHIQNIGGQPDENLGMKGKVAELMLNRKLDFTNINEVIEKAIEGETEGVNAAEKILRGNLEDESRTIAELVLDNDRDSINKLKG